MLQPLQCEPFAVTTDPTATKTVRALNEGLGMHGSMDLPCRCLCCDGLVNVPWDAIQYDAAVRSTDGHPLSRAGMWVAWAARRRSFNSPFKVMEHFENTKCADFCATYVQPFQSAIGSALNPREGAPNTASGNTYSAMETTDVEPGAAAIDPGTVNLRYMVMPMAESTTQQQVVRHLGASPNAFAMLIALQANDPRVRQVIRSDGTGRPFEDGATEMTLPPGMVQIIELLTLLWGAQCEDVAMRLTYERHVWTLFSTLPKEHADFLLLVAGGLGLDPHVAMETCLLYTSPSPRDATLSRMPSSA